VAVIVSAAKLENKNPQQIRQGTEAHAFTFPPARRFSSMLVFLSAANFPRLDAKQTKKEKEVQPRAEKKLADNVSQDRRRRNWKIPKRLPE
jgi:hypothetical protein